MPVLCLRSRLFAAGELSAHLVYPILCKAVIDILLPKKFIQPVEGIVITYQ